MEAESRHSPFSSHVWRFDPACYRAEGICLRHSDLISFLLFGVEPSFFLTLWRLQTCKVIPHLVEKERKEKGKEESGDKAQDWCLWPWCHKESCLWRTSGSRLPKSTATKYYLFPQSMTVTFERQGKSDYRKEMVFLQSLLEFVTPLT